MSLEQIRRRILPQLERLLRSLSTKKSRKTGEDSALADSSPPGDDRSAEIARVTGLPVIEPELYERALRHASIVRHEPDKSLRSNERLEFLGDAVLGMAAAEFLFERFPEKNEGFLTRVRAKVVNKKALAQYADRIGIQHLLIMSADMDRAGGRLNPSVLANAYEALIGAVYLDHGYSAARDFVLKTMEDTFNLEDLARRRENYKSLLLEYAQARGWPQPQYRVLSEEGPGHRRVFAVEVVIGADSHGRGRGRSKKTAEQSAARRALQALRDGGEENAPDGEVAMSMSS